MLGCLDRPQVAGPHLIERFQEFQDAWTMVGVYFALVDLVTSVFLFRELEVFM